jgi:hypothetical protein
MKNLKIQLFVFSAVLVLIAGGALGAKAQNNPTQQQTDEWRRRGTCNDPWVSMAVSSFAYGGIYLAQTSNGADGECDVSQYNGGRWNSFAELVQGMDRARADMRTKGLQWEAYKVGNDKALFLVDSSNNKILLGKLISQDGGSLISQDGGSLRTAIAKIVAQGGGNIVAQGGGNLVLNDLKTAGIVAQGGGNLISNGVLSAAQATRLSSFIPSRVVVAVKPVSTYSVVSTNDAYKIGTSYYVLSN